jgi:hypothetical protein
MAPRSTGSPPAAQLALARVPRPAAKREAASRRGVGPAATAFALAELAAPREARELLAGCKDPGLARERVAREEHRLASGPLRRP